MNRRRPAFDVPTAMLLIAATLAPAAEARTDITFEPASIIGWERHSFSGETDYTLSQRSAHRGVRAECEEGTASGLIYREGIDLTRTPIIEWRWRIVEPIASGAPRNKNGDDYAARLYAVDESPILRWRTRAMNYVSTTRTAKGDHWPNAYADQAMMVAVDGADSDSGWQIHRRNLREDFARFHDRDITEIDTLAIMTDCDDTGDRAEAIYGTIRLMGE
ncbi:DUF3047 domain-containing protein [Spiribacter vilamensis]|uniref:DUF3047 family protein n=1 Tax=Spiribacter vilamensis TaxID=531306 RepID=A0A4Q8CZ59_9GAMM|nr:DUF3047 domain-containing protein [Spiribacter vilamensis]RZU98301.1 DUF3047 family protein [Spiribacter vilamensis]